MIKRGIRTEREDDEEALIEVVVAVGEGEEEEEEESEGGGGGDEEMEGAVEEAVVVEEEERATMVCLNTEIFLFAGFHDGLLLLEGGRVDVNRLRILMVLRWLLKQE